MELIFHTVFSIRFKLKSNVFVAGLAIFLLAGCADNTGVTSGSSLRTVHLTCEYMENPAVVDVIQPRLSWINVAREGERGQKQTAFQVRVASSKEKLVEPDLWDGQNDPVGPVHPREVRRKTLGFQAGMLVAGAGEGP